MKKYLLFLLFITLGWSVYGQQIIKFTPQQIESLFLEQNLQLIAERMNIDIADAEIVQAKLWDNPTLSVTDISFWSSKSQRDGEDEIIPPLFGSVGKNTQFGIELSQLIQTARKRGKLIAREIISKDISIQEFEEVLRGLKTELRTSINEMRYVQSYKNVLERQKHSLVRLIDAYNKQIEQGNLSVNELLRLQSALLEIENEENELKIELNSRQKILKSLLNAHPDVYIEIEEADNYKNPHELAVAGLIELALEHRPDFKIAELRTKYYEKALAYEKSQRVPDLTISANYDRWGGVWKNFIGVGVSIDLPTFNRNQGNIKAAKISKTQSDYFAQQQHNILLHEITEAYNNYLLTYDFYSKTMENPLLAKLEDMLAVYSKNLLNKNISMLEFIDFMESYTANMQTILSVRKNLNEQFNELQYTIGIDL